MKIQSYLFFSLIFILFYSTPTFGLTGGPLKSKQSSSNGSAQAFCLYPNDNKFEIIIENVSTEDIEINNLDGIFDDGIENSVDIYQFYYENVPVEIPYTIPACNNNSACSELVVVMVMHEIFDFSHHSFGYTTADMDIMVDYSYLGESHIETFEEQKSICGSIVVVPLKNVETDCEFYGDDFPAFKLSNSTTSELLIEEISVTLENQNNEVVELITLDGNGEEPVSLPYELLPFNESLQNDEMQLKVDLAHPLGYELEGDVTSMTFSYSYTIDEVTFQESTTINFDFKGCNEQRKSTITVFPNPVTNSTNFNFLIKKEVSTVSAWLLPKKPGSGSVISLINNREFHKGDHQFKLPIKRLKGGLYELVIKIDDRIMSTAVILARE